MPQTLAHGSFALLWGKRLPTPEIAMTPSLQTPHSGYHFSPWLPGRFFEGWYYRVTLPQLGESFAFMYSIEDPQGGQPHSGGAAQILRPGDRYLWQTLPDVMGFWAAGDGLALNHCRREG
nr:tocopherol cyclase family protein [Spirulina subsalsa]